jgi:hypothetical protein
MGEAPIFLPTKATDLFFGARYRINLIVDRRTDGKRAAHISAVGAKVEHSLQL